MDEDEIIAIFCSDIVRGYNLHLEVLGGCCIETEVLECNNEIVGGIVNDSRPTSLSSTSS